MTAIRRHARTVAIVLILFAVPGVAAAALGLWGSSRDRSGYPTPQEGYDFDQRSPVLVDPDAPGQVIWLPFRDAP